MSSWSDDLWEQPQWAVLHARCLCSSHLRSGHLHQILGMRHLPQENKQLRLPEVPGKGQEQGSLGEKPQKQEKMGTLLLLLLLLQRPHHL